MFLKPIIILALFGLVLGCGKPPTARLAPEPGPSIELGSFPLSVTGFAEPIVLNEFHSDQRPRYLVASFYYQSHFSGRIHFFESKFLAADCAGPEPTIEYVWVETDAAGFKSAVHFKKERDLSVRKDLSYVLQVTIVNFSACQSLYYGFAMTRLTDLN